MAFLIASLLAIEGLHVWGPGIHAPRLVNVDPRFPWFVRTAYVWLLVSSILGIVAVRWDSSGGIWGASRHAITVGFVAGMVFAIGQRVLPTFCGMCVLWSTRLMWQYGCLCPLYYLVIVGTATLLDPHIARTFILLALIGNPVDPALVAGLLIREGATIFGAAGAVLIRTYGNTALAVLLLVLVASRGPRLLLS